MNAINVLLSHGADVNAKEKLRGTTALMWAAANGQAAAVKVLAEHGADVGARSGTTSKGRPAYLAPTVKELSVVAAAYSRSSASRPSRPSGPLPLLSVASGEIWGTSPSTKRTGAVGGRSPLTARRTTADRDWYRSFP